MARKDARYFDKSIGLFFTDINLGIFWMFKSDYWHDAGVGLFFKECWWRG